VPTGRDETHMRCTGSVRSGSPGVDDLEGMVSFVARCKERIICLNSANTKFTV